MNKTHITTVNDLRQYGHYMTQLFLAEKPEIVTVRQFNVGEESYGVGGERHVISKAGQFTAIKLPDGGYVEIYPHELENIKEKHTLMWED